MLLFPKSSPSLGAFLALVFWSVTAGASTPTATTAYPALIQANAATLSAVVNANGLPTTAAFQWGSSTSYGNQTPVASIPGGTSPLTLTAALSRLSTATTYHYRLVTTNADGQAYGADQVFQTISLPPAATTKAATGVAANSAVLNGAVVPNGALVYYQWGTTTSYGNTTSQATLSGSASVAWSASISGLSPGVTYHYRLVAVNSGGASYGGDIAFATPAPQPTATTSPASLVGAAAATLNGTVYNPGLAASVQFQWGLTTSYGSQTPGVTLGAGYGTYAASARLAGLAPSTLYHYRVTISYPGGSVAGQDAVFVTAPSLPTVMTLAPGALSTSGATLSGNVNPNGYAATTYFQWGLTTSYGNSTSSSSQAAGSAYVPLSTPVAGLLSCTTYHYRAVAANASGTVYGADQSFTTLGPSPTVTTLPATPGSAGAFTLNGNVNPDGLPTTASFLWGTTPAYGHLIWVGPTLNGNATLPESVVLNGLSPGVTYHYSVTAASAGGAAYGADRSFVPVAVAPTVVTLPASLIGSSSAQMNGTVNANGYATQSYFRYGLTATYGSSTAPTGVGAGTAPVTESQFVAGLQPYTQYHYQIVASNVGGTSYGQDVTFTTLAPSPEVTTGAPTSVTPTSAVLNGSVDPYGQTATYHFEWGTSTAYGATAGNGATTVPTPVSANLGGLSPGITYHYRLTAQSIGGSTVGNDQTFTTPTHNLVLKEVVHRAGGISFSWDAEIGQHYTIQYKTGIEDNAWQDLFSLTATNSSPQVTDSVPQTGQRVYRVVQSRDY